MSYIPPSNDYEYLLDETNEEELVGASEVTTNESTYTDPFIYTGPSDIGAPIEENPDPEPIEDDTVYLKVTYYARETLNNYDPYYLEELYDNGAKFYAIYDDDTEEEVSWDEIQDLDPLETEIDISEAIASASNQHFWNDTNGVHVSEVAKEDWDDAVSDNFSDLSSSKNYYNILMNSLGLLLRRALYNLVSINRAAISFYDGLGNESSNIMASFGRNSAQIGRSAGKHVVIDNDGITAYDGDQVAPLNASNITAAEANIEQLQANTADISTIRANSAKVQSLSAEALTAATAYIAALNTANVTANDISADKATIAALISGNVTTDTLRAASAYISSLVSSNISASTLTADHASLGTVVADYLKSTDMEAERARVATLIADYATVANLNAAVGRISNLESTKADISLLESDYIDADTIEANYLKTDISNTTVGWIENGTIKNGAITNAMINSVSANKLTAGTIDASVINVTNLQADDISVTRINGQTVSGKTLVDALEQHEDDISDLDTKIDTQVEALNDRIDGAIETFTGTAVPTLSNSPASSWNTTKLKDQHVGDVYYVVNSDSQQNGYCYRFTKSGSSYSWQLIKDSDVTAALGRLQTAEGKISTIEQFDSDISSWKTDTDDEIASIKSNHTTLAGRVTTAEGELETKVDQTTFNTLEQTVGTNSSSITSLTTTTTQLRTDFDNIEIGGRNLLRGTADPHLNSEIVVGRAAIIGNGIIRLTSTSSSAYAATRSRYLDFSYFEAGEYTLSFDAKFADVETTYTKKVLDVYVGYSNASTWNVAFAINANNIYKGKSHGASLTNEWQRFSMTINPLDTPYNGTLVPTDGCSLRVEFFISASSIPVDIRLIKLEKGNRPTAWSPAPEDVERKPNILRGTNQSIELLPYSKREEAYWSDGLWSTSSGTYNNGDGEIVELDDGPDGQLYAFHVWSTDSNNKDFVQREPPFVPNVEYQASYYVRLTPGVEQSRARAQVRIYGYATESATGTTALKTGYSPYLTSTEWVRATFNFVLTDAMFENSNKMKTFLIGVYGAGDIQICGVKLEQSDYVTKWAPSPFDSISVQNINKVSNKVSEITQTIDGITTRIGSVETTLTTKADGSTVESISSDLNDISETVAGHTQTISSINSTLSTKADGSTVSTLSSQVNDISDTVNGHTSQLTSITQTQTSIQGNAVKSTVQLWFTKANTSAPSKPTAHITVNDATKANRWNLAVPNYNATYPNYYYCYEYQYLDGSYGWSAVTRDIATGEMQERARTAITNAAAADTKASNAQADIDGLEIGGRNLFAFTNVISGYPQEKAVGNTYFIVSMSSNHEAYSLIPIEGNSEYTLQYWVDDANHPGWVCIQLLDENGSVVQKVVREYPGANYYIKTFTSVSTATTALVSGRHLCPGYDYAKIKFEKGNRATDWTPAPEDINADISTAQTAADTAQATADKNIKESIQLWITKASSSAPAKPTSKVTSTAVSGNAWTTKVPTYNSTYPYYFYCMQYIAADGTVTWSDVVYDQATTEAQSVARTATTNLSTLQQDYATFKQTTQNFESTIGSTYATKTEVSAVQTNLDNLEIGGRNLIGHFNWSADTAAHGSAIYTCDADGTVTSNNIDNTTWSLANSQWQLTLEAGTYQFTIEVIHICDAWGSAALQVWNSSTNILSFTSAVFNNGGVETKSFTLSSTTNIGIKIKPGKNAVCRFKLEKGTKPTDWTPASEDQTAYVNDYVNDYVNSSINNLEIGGRNLLRNSSLISMGSSNYKNIDVTLWGRENVAADDILTISFDALTEDDGCWMDVYWRDSSTSYTGAEYFRQAFQLTNQLSHFEYSGESKIVPTEYLRVRTNNSAYGSAVNHPVTIYNLKLEKGNKATDWTPAPEDVDFAIETAPKYKYVTSTYTIAYSTWLDWSTEGRTLNNFILATSDDYALLNVGDIACCKGTNSTDNKPIYILIEVTSKNGSLKISGIAHGLIDPQIRTTVNAIESRVTSAETSITQNNEAIALKANASDVYTKSQTDGLISTEVTDRNSAIEQSASAINLSVSQTYSTKTEATQMAQPNLSPFFTMDPTDVYNATTNPDGYWDVNKAFGSGANVVEQLTDGWAHIDFTNNGSGNTWLTVYEHCVWRHRAGDLKGSTKYTVMFEFRNVVKTGNVTCIGTTQHATLWSSMFVGNSDKGSVAVADGVQYHVGTTIEDPSSLTGNKCTTRTLITFPAGSSLNADFRISLYEGKYSGPYKPYNSNVLYATNTSLEAAKASIKVTTDGITSEVSKISSIKHLTSTITNGWTLSALKSYATDGQSTTFNVASTANVRVGDTVYIKGTDSTRNCPVYIKATVTQINSATQLVAIGHGYSDAIPVNSAISSINQSAETIKIQASRVEIDGTAIFNSISSSVDSAITDKGYATTSQAQGYATTAKNEAISAAASDATTKANTAKSEAISAAASDATTKANTAKSEAISAAASDATTKANAVQTNLDNLEIGGRNLFTWPLSGTKWKDEEHSLNTYQNTGSFMAFNGSLLFDPSETVGEQYTISFWAKSPNGTTQLKLYNNNGYPKYFYIPQTVLTTALGDEWEFFSLTVTNIEYSGDKTPSTNEMYWRRIEIFAPGAIGVLVKQIKVEKGNRATDWTPALEDVDAAIDEKADAADSTEYIVGTQTSQTGSWTGVTRDSSLYTGKKIAYKLPVAGSGNASLQLKDSSGNNVGGNIAVYLGTTRMTTHFGAGSVIQMVYDGTYWRATSIPNTNNYDRRLHNNNVKAASNLARYSICAGTSAGYHSIVAGLQFDLAYPILYLGANNASGQTYAVASGAQTAAMYEAMPSVTVTYTGTPQSPTANAMLYLKGTLNNGLFIIASSDYLTTVVPTAATNPIEVYIPLGIFANGSTTAIYFSSSKDMYAFVDGQFRQVNPTDVVATQKIYYRTESTTAPTAPTSWITTNNAATYNAWNLAVPPLAANKNEGSTKYAYLYSCEQRHRLDGTVGCGAVSLDSNATIIDGGQIITNSITALQIAANSITATEIDATNLHVSAANIDGTLTIGKVDGLQTALDGKQASGDYATNTQAQGYATTVQTNLDNLEIGGRNLLRNTRTPVAANYAIARCTVTDGVLTITPTTSPAYAKHKVDYLDYDDYGTGTYTVSCDVRLSSAETTYTNKDFRIYYGFSAASRIANAFSSSYDRYGSTIISDDDLTYEWKRVSVTFEVPTKLATGKATALVSGSKLSVQPYVLASSIPVEVRFLKLERGSKATDWTPAPEDAEADISEVQTLASTTSTNLTTEINQRKATYGTCDTAAATAAKAVTCSNFALYVGAQITVRFKYGNTAAQPTLSVNGTTATAVEVMNNSQPTASMVKWPAYSNCTFTYDGTYWRFTGSDYDQTTATNYITADDTGISIHMSGNSTTYQRQTATGTTFYVNNQRRTAMDSTGLKIYVDDGTDANLAASFTTDGAQIGNSSKSHMELDYHSLQMISAENEPYFYVSDFRDSSGIAEVEDLFISNGSGNNFALSATALDTLYTVIRTDADGNPSSSGGTITKSTTRITFESVPVTGTIFKVKYTTASRRAKAYTLGIRDDYDDDGNAEPLGMLSIAEGYLNVASGLFSHAGGNKSQARGVSSFAFGTEVKAIGFHSYAEGSQTIAFGNVSHAEGSATEAIGTVSHAEGEGAKAIGYGSHAEGSNATATAHYSHAEGQSTIASGSLSHAEGWRSEANGAYSHAQNQKTIAGYNSQTTIGKYNNNIETNAFEIGNGTADDDRSNALTVDWNGNLVAAGTLKAQKKTGTMTLNTTNCTQSTDYNIAWHNGIVATVQLGYFQLKSALANNSTLAVGTVPSGFRPASRLYANVAIASAAVGGMVSAYIASDGAITLINRSGVSLPTTAAFAITATYCI